MTPLPPIIWIGNDWFAENRTSSHHVALRMSGYTKVLYFGCPGLRRPQSTPQDLRRALAKTTRALAGVVDLSASLSVGTVVQIPFHHLSAVVRLNGAVGAWTLNRAVRRAHMGRPVVWCTVPHALPFIERLDPSLVVYYCIDQYSAMPGVDSLAVQDLDERLARRADLIIAASRPVFDRHRQIKPATRLIPHGVDAGHFARPAELARRPEELSDVAAPIIGFFGCITGSIDLLLIDWLARQFPKATFVMIGQIAVPATELPKASNIRFLGPRPYALLPSFGHYFDVAIIPYRETAATFAANPLKLREYLAMGVPVVSVSIPEVEQFRHVVSVAHNREEFADALRQALSNSSDEKARQARVSAVAGATWDARVAELVAAMREALAARSGASA